MGDGRGIRTSTIGELCERLYGVTVPIFAEEDADDPSAHRMFAWRRTEEAGLLGKAITWSSTLIGPTGPSPRTAWRAVEPATA